MRIGVCDVNEDETRRTIYLLNTQVKQLAEDDKSVTFVPYNYEMVVLDIDDGKFDCDMFITELSYPNGKNGVKLAKQINEAVPSCSILFYTQKIPNELDIYDARHINCMLKGIHDGRLVSFLQGYIENNTEREKKKYIKVHYDRTVSVLDCRNIMYIKIENRVTKYYTATKTKDKHDIYYEYRPLSEIEAELPNNFVRCHASAIVNRDYIKSYNHQVVTMADGGIVRIGRKYGGKNNRMNL